MRLQRLPRSITGFFGRGEPRRSIDPRRFRTACHLAAQAEGGAVTRFCLDLLSRNHYSAQLDTRAESITVLCSASHPYVAFAPVQRRVPTWRDRTFVTPIVEAAFEALTDFQPLDAHWLMSDVTADALVDLLPSEIRLVRHWEPGCIGGIVFNEWD